MRIQDGFTEFTFTSVWILGPSKKLLHVVPPPIPCIICIISQKAGNLDDATGRYMGQQARFDNATAAGAGHGC